MQFIDLKAQYRRIEEKIQKRIQTVLDHGQYILGPEVSMLEEQLAEFVGCNHAVCVGNGSDGITLCLMAMGIRPGDEIIMPSFSFFATAEMPALLGAKPVYVDIHPETYNMDETLVEAAITEKTKVIMPVSLYGQTCAMGQLQEIAKKHGVALVEDAAQSFGATYYSKRSCSLSDFAVTSFFPAKPLGAYGDAGACFTNNEAWADKLRELRNHGQQGRYNHTALGINSRMDSLQAGILLEKLAIFPDEIEAREKVASRYKKALKGEVAFQYLPENYTSVYAQFTVEVDDRDSVVKKLNEKGIPTSIHYPSLMPDQPAFAYHEHQAETPVAKKVSERCLSLPIHPYLEEQDQNRIIEELLQAIR